MSQLKDEYEKESGLSSGSLMCHVYASTDEFVNWLEAKVKKLTAATVAQQAKGKITRYPKGFDYGLSRG